MDFFGCHHTICNVRISILSCADLKFALTNWSIEAQAGLSTQKKSDRNDTWGYLSTSHGERDFLMGKMFFSPLHAHPSTF